MRGARRVAGRVARRGADATRLGRERIGGLVERYRALEVQEAAARVELAARKLQRRQDLVAQARAMSEVLSRDQQDKVSPGAACPITAHPVLRRAPLSVIHHAWLSRKLGMPHVPHRMDAATPDLVW